MSVYLGAFLLILNCIFFGIGNAFSSDLLDQIPLFTYLSLRFGAAVVIFLLVFHRRLFRNIPSLRRGVWPLVGICLFTVASYVFSNVSFALAKPSIAGFMVSVSVLFSPFLAALLYKTRIGFRIYPIILLTVVGLYLLCGGFDLRFSFGWGEFFGLLTSVVFAAQLVFTGKYLSVYRWDPIMLAAVQAGAVALISIPCALIFDPPLVWSRYDMKDWLSLGFIVLFCTLLLYIFQNFALERVSPVFASVAMSTEMIFTMIASHFICGDTLSLSAIIGGILVFASVVLASLFTEQAPGKTEKTDE